MVKALLTRDTGNTMDSTTGTFRDEAQALLWAINMVATFYPVREVVRTTVDDEQPEYTFLASGNKKAGFMAVFPI